LRWVALEWRHDGARVVSPSGAVALPWVVAENERYALRLAVGGERLWLRTADGRRPFMLSDDGGASFREIDPVPGSAPLSAFEAKVHRAAGVVSILDGATLWVHAHGAWVPRPLPADIRVADVSLDARGGLWCAGAAASDRIPGETTEAAVRFQEHLGAPFVARSPRLGLADATRTIRDGGLAELRAVDAEGEPVVASSICSWLLDDSSSFLFVLGDHAEVVRFGGEMIRTIDRSLPGAPRVFTGEGGVWQRDERRWQHRSLRAALARALDAGGRHLLVRGLAARGADLAAAVEVAPEGAGVGVPAAFTAVCLSRDDGASFTVAARADFADGAELQDVAWLAS